LIKKSLNKE